jgi:hypothetical protein
MSIKTDVLIIDGGIAGISIAGELSRYELDQQNEGFIVETSGEEIRTRYVVNAAVLLPKTYREYPNSDPH